MISKVLSQHSLTLPSTLNHVALTHLSSHIPASRDSHLPKDLFTVLTL